MYRYMYMNIHAVRVKHYKLYQFVKKGYRYCYNYMYDAMESLRGAQIVTNCLYM